VELTVERVGSSGQRILWLPLRGKGTPAPTWLEALLLQPTAYYPLFFLVVGLGVLFLRFDDANAWRLALLFAGFIGVAPLYEGAVPAPLRGFAVFLPGHHEVANVPHVLLFFRRFPRSFPA
jgi:hypothetical protein